MIQQITSVNNPFVKKIILLKEKSKIRKKENLFVIEGLRELTLAIKGGYTVENVLFLPELILKDELKKIINPSTKLIEISKSVFEKIAHRSTTEGIIATAKTKNHTLKNLNFKSNNPLILVAEAPEKPGNIGAILRTADAAKIDAVLIANPKTDLYNPNIIRSSIGCVFTNNIGVGSTTDILSFLKQQNIEIFVAALHKNAEKYTKQDFTKPSAIVVGTEATGLSDEWLKNNKKIIIPMRGEIDSLNVSVSAAIIIFEAIRQRDLTN
jgi:TrmH family RNA methyltransferase